MGLVTGIGIMKRILSVITILLASVSCGKHVQEDVLKVMSYNVRYDNPDDGENAWELRRYATPEMIRDIRPDVFGVQEAQAHQIRYIEENCPEYGSIGVGRDDGKEAGEFMSIFYDKERVKLLDWGTIWLSPTPEKPSRGWDAGCFRTATWAFMEHTGSGKEFFYVNTHLDHVGKNARKNGLELIIKLIKEKNVERLPVILTGDFNVTPDDSFTLESVYAWLNNASATASEADSVPTYNGWGKRENTFIDYIWWKDFSSCREYRVIRNEYAGIRYVSDHWPITAELVF